MKKRLLVYTACFMCFITLAGCGLLNKSQPPEQSDQSEEIPKQLAEIESTIEKIFMVLDGPVLSSDKNQKDQKEQNSQTQKQDQDQDQKQSKEQDQNQGQKQEQEQSKGQDQNQGQKPSQEQGQEQQNKEERDPWQQATLDVQALHVSWNEYMPEITKKGVRKEVLDGFGDALNNLTKITSDKDKMKTFLALNKLYENIPDFYSFYQTKIPSQLKQVIFFTRSSILYSTSDDWDKAFSDMDKLKSTWALLKNSMGNQQQEDSIKLELSIYELEKVIKERNKDLIQIKGKITLNNIKALQKSMEKK